MPHDPEWSLLFLEFVAYAARHPQFRTGLREPLDQLRETAAERLTRYAPGRAQLLADGLDEAQLLDVLALAEQALAAAEDEREDGEEVLVDYIAISSVRFSLRIRYLASSARSPARTRSIMSAKAVEARSWSPSSRASMPAAPGVLEPIVRGLEALNSRGLIDAEEVLRHRCLMLPHAASLCGARSAGR